MSEVELGTSRAIETKTKIIRAATRLAFKVGYDNTTIRSICREADISIGAFYHHFSSKQELLNQAFLIFDATLSEDHLDNSSSDSPVEALKTVLLNQSAFIVDEAGKMIKEYYQAILKQEEHQAVNPDRLYYRTVHRYAEQALSEGLFYKGYTPQYVTEFLIKFVRGCIIDWCLHDGSYNVIEQTGRELDLLFFALAQAPSI